MRKRCKRRGGAHGARGEGALCDELEERMTINPRPAKKEKTEMTRPAPKLDAKAIRGMLKMTGTTVERADDVT